MQLPARQCTPSQLGKRHDSGKVCVCVAGFAPSNGAAMTTCHDHSNSESVPCKLFPNFVTSV